MPGPPPPPPPINNAPPPSSSGGEQGRNLLLESIRAGKSLKKAVTVDKSAPVLGGTNNRPKEPTNGRTLPMVPSSNNKPVPNANSAPMGLGGLFAGGMPKLKPTGLRSASSDNVNSSNTIRRGPPPAPPPVTQKPQIQVTETSNNTVEEPTPRGFGKTTPLPKTPTLSSGSLQRPSPPPKKLSLSVGTSVSRAQSMRLSRSPPVLAPTPPSLHQSQDCLNENQTRPVSTRVLRPPVVRPPSPPTSKSSANSITRTAPPPPVRGMVTPPPPPPATHRTLPHQRLAPPPPPTPPTRCSSTQNGQNSNDIESRFGKYFHPSSTFPHPDVYQGFQKVYNSKNAPKQQAPPPPMSQSPHNRSSMLNMSSSQGKQWHTSLAC